MTKLTDEWQTPQWLFDELDNEFNFEIDLASTKENCKCAYRIENFLSVFEPNIFGQGEKLRSGFLNPPYSNPKPFIQQAWDLSLGMKIVCLVKADPSTKWWGIFWDYDRINPDGTKGGARPGCEVRFHPKRIKFIKPDGTEAGAANFPSAIVIMDRRNRQ